MNNTAPTEKLGPYDLAVQSLSLDIRYIAFWYPFLVIPDLFESLYPKSELSFYLGLHAVDRFIALLFLAQIGTRWFGRISGNEQIKLSFKGWAILLICGFSVWAIFEIPGVVASDSVPKPLSFFLIATCGAGMVLAYRFYFYFIPPLCGVTSFKETFHLAKRYGQNYSYAPVRAEIGALGIGVTLGALAALPAPDGAEIICLVMISILEGVGWVLSSYVAFGLVTAATTESNRFNLSPLAQHASNPWLAKVLEPRRASAILVAGILLWIGNSIQAASYPPRPTITVQSVTLTAKEATVMLNLEDTAYKFRGFIPFKFHLAGENHVIVSRYPKTATVHENGQSKDARVALNVKTNTAKLELHFEAQVGSELDKLEDLYLWYGNSRVALLSTKKMASSKKY